ncbi:MAG: hypothetical protein ABIV21_02530 [Pyrinomonadaceae bacterium]
MGAFNKFKDILKIGAGVARPFAPGAVGSILDVVNATLDKGDASPTSAGALQELAAHVDETGEAILVLHRRIEKLEINQRK